MWKRHTPVTSLWEKNAMDVLWRAQAIRQRSFVFDETSPRSTQYVWIWSFPTLLCHRLPQLHDTLLRSHFSQTQVSRNEWPWLPVHGCIAPRNCYNPIQQTPVRSNDSSATMCEFTNWTEISLSTFIMLPLSTLLSIPLYVAIPTWNSVVPWISPSDNNTYRQSQVVIELVWIAMVLICCQCGWLRSNLVGALPRTNGVGLDSSVLARSEAEHVILPVHSHNHSGTTSQYEERTSLKMSRDLQRTATELHLLVSTSVYWDRPPAK